MLRGQMILGILCIYFLIKCHDYKIIHITYFTFVQFFSIFAVGSKDATVRLYTIGNYKNFRPYSLTGHSDAIVGIFFEENSLNLMAVSRLVIDLSVL